MTLCYSVYLCLGTCWHRRLNPTVPTALLHVVSAPTVASVLKRFQNNELQCNQKQENETARTTRTWVTYFFLAESPSCYSGLFFTCLGSDRPAKIHFGLFAHGDE